MKQDFKAIMEIIISHKPKIRDVKQSHYSQVAICFLAINKAVVKKINQGVLAQL